MPVLLMLGVGAAVVSSGCGAAGSVEPPSAAARPGASAVVWAVGDGADGGRPAADLARRIAGSRVDRFLYLGDVYENGTAEEFQAYFDRVYGSLVPRTVPTPGNHDWPRRNDGYFPYWRRALGRPVPSYQALRLGGWDVLSLNSEEPHGLASRQVRWIRAQVQAPGTCRLAFWHRPRYSAGLHGDQPDTEPLWKVLRGHATLILNGHDHDLQRLRPVGGLTEFVVGAGGHGLYRVASRDPRRAFADDTRYGALRLTLRPGLAEYAIVDTEGRTIDAGRVPCRPS